MARTGKPSISTAIRGAARIADQIEAWQARYAANFDSTRYAGQAKDVVLHKLIPHLQRQSRITPAGKE